MNRASDSNRPGLAEVRGARGARCCIFRNLATHDSENCHDYLDSANKDHAQNRSDANGGAHSCCHGSDSVSEGTKNP
jgi:hypothetical protein